MPDIILTTSGKALDRSVVSPGSLKTSKRSMGSGTLGEETQAGSEVPCSYTPLLRKHGVGFASLLNVHAPHPSVEAHAEQQSCHESDATPPSTRSSPGLHTPTNASSS
jgi:hypothetical protein